MSALTSRHCFLTIVCLIVASSYANNVANAQEAGGAEVRLGARALGGGSFTIVLQYRVDGSWRTVIPSRNVLSRSASADRWHTTSAIEVEVAQARAEIGVLNRRWTDEAGPEQFTVMLGDARYRARCGRLILSLKDDGFEMQTGSRNCDDIVTVAPPELANPTDVGAQVLRVAARRLSNGGIELGLLRLVDGRWEALRQPARAVLSGLALNTWRYTSLLELPALPAQVFGELRRGASITTRDGDFDVEVDGRVYRTRCGVLDLNILTEHVLVDTAAERCHGSAPLLTICPTSNCDVQQNAVYAWESRQIGTSLDQIELTRSEAQAVVNAVFADFFTRSTPPTVSFSSEQSHGHAGRSEIVLGTDVQRLGAVVHELAHALIAQILVTDAGHGGAFTALLLHLWERYFPIADVQAARDDAKRHGIEVASRSPIRARFSEARQVIGQLFCDRPHDAIGPDLCDAASGAMSAWSDEEIAGRYVGFGGSLSDGFWWSAHEGDDGRFRTRLSLDSMEAFHGQSVARLSIDCNVDNELEVEVWWRQIRQLPATLTYRFGGGEAVTASWLQLTGTWGNDSWAVHQVPDALSFLFQLSWQARFGTPLIVQYEQFGAGRRATFDLKKMFGTPAQRNLARCGSESVVVDSDGFVVDSSRDGDDFWWGVDRDENPPTTWVVKQTNIIDSERRARLQIKCEDGDLEFGLNWEVDRDLHRSIRYIAGRRDSVDEDWQTGTSTWGNDEYKWIGSDDAVALVASIAWEAQSERWFAARVWERHNTDRSYAAVWDLDGLFDTPVQPNLARCGR